jgi:hypothetical protein
MTDEKPIHSYIGRCAGCKRVLVIAADMQTARRFTARSVAEMIASGLIVERVLRSEATLDFGDCACPQTIQEEMPL